MDHTQNIGIVGETSGVALNKIISFLELVHSGKDMVPLNLAQNVPITQRFTEEVKRQISSSFGFSYKRSAKCNQYISI